jgi:surface antigen
MKPAALCILMIASPAFGAGGMDFLNDLPAASFTQEDRDLMMKTTKEVLESTEPRATKDWSNPKSGNSGNLLVRSQFTATDGATCKRVVVTNNVKARSLKNVATHTMCKYEGRGWLLHPEAVPAPASPK